MGYGTEVRSLKNLWKGRYRLKAGEFTFRVEDNYWESGEKGQGHKKKKRHPGEKMGGRGCELGRTAKDQLKDRSNSEVEAFRTNDILKIYLMTDSNPKWKKKTPTKVGGFRFEQAFGQEGEKVMLGLRVKKVKRK